MLGHIVKNLGADYDERVLPSLGNEVLKSVVAQYKAEELLSHRAVVSNQIRNELESRVQSFNLILDDVAITNLTFGKEFASAIEKKQVAEQEAERQKYLVEKADQEKKAAVIIAEGEAEAAKMISAATNSAGNSLIEVRRIERAREVAEILSRSRNIVYLPSSGGDGGGSNLLLNVNNNN